LELVVPAPGALVEVEADVDDAVLDDDGAAGVSVASSLFDPASSLEPPSVPAFELPGVTVARRSFLAQPEPL
jgi:hypothetical protein